MKRLKLLILTLLCVAFSVNAQQKKYVPYTVKYGETIRSIAKDYDLSTRDLLKLNPGVGRRPAPETVIIVPNKNYGKEIANSNFKYYDVKLKETISSISAKFNISAEELIFTNPELKSGIRIGMRLVIPPNKVKLPENGDNFMFYTVVKGDTKYNLSNRFNLTQEALVKLNPEINNGLKIGMKLVLPKPVVSQPTENSPYFLYIVVKNDTEYSLAKRFETTQEELRRLNPELKDGLKLGMTLTIPKTSEEIAKEEAEENYVIHEVVKDDTVYSLTKKYKVSTEELLHLNPELIDGLKIGMILKMKPKEVENFTIESNINLNTFRENLNYSRPLNIVLLLPYELNKLADSVINNNFSKRNSLLNIATDFHLGASMAIDSLHAKGLRVNVHYMDSENSNIKLQQIVASNNFNNVDVVVGPLFFDKAYWISKRIESPVIAPFYSKKQGELSYENLIKSTPDTEDFEDKMLAYMEKHYHEENIVIINDGLPENQTNLWRIVGKIKTFAPSYKISVVKPEEGYIDKNKIEEKLMKETKNWALLISDEKLTIAAAMNNLKGFVENYEISLFALNKDKNFDNIDNNLLAKLNFIYATSEYLNINSKETDRFYKKYRDKNFAFPSVYAIRGFDVVYDALVRIASYRNLEDGLMAGQSTRISAFFNYNQKPTGFYKNKGVYLVKYQTDLSSIIVE